MRSASRKVVDALARRLDPDHPERVQHRRGQFHQVLIGPNRVISIARTEAAASRLPLRARKLESVSTLCLRVTTPIVLHVDDCWLEMSRIPGTPLPPGTQLSRTELEFLSRDMAHFFRVTSQGTVLKGADEAIRLAAPDRWTSFANDVRQSLFPLMREAGRQRATRELEAVCVLPPISSHLVHGDLGGDNLHFDRDDMHHRLVGIVDWDETHIGDPAEDLASLESTFGSCLTQATVSKAGFDSSILKRIAAIRDTFALQQAWAGFRDGDPEALADGIRDYT